MELAKFQAIRDLCKKQALKQKEMDEVEEEDKEDVVDTKSDRSADILVKKVLDRANERINIVVKD